LIPIDGELNQHIVGFIEVIAESAPEHRQPATVSLLGLSELSPEATMNGDGKQSQGGGWLLWVGVGMYALSSALSLVFSEGLRFGDHPGSDIPWYFIRQDYIDGIVMGVGWLTCLLVGLAFWKQHKSNAGILIAQTAIWFSIPVWRAFVITLRSDHVLSPILAKTTWSSFEAYENDPLFWRGWEAFFIIALLAAATTFILGVLKKRRAGRDAQGA
jgi:hypothetical protein